MKYMPIEEFVDDPLIPVIDVRSEGEFSQGHIPGAINIPLFSNEERAEIGTVYKHEGKDKAIQLGLKITGPKLAGLVEQVKSIVDHDKVNVHCWRGGMRSSSFAWLLELAGYQAHVLNGGYKAYRNFVLETFERKYDLVIIGGKTGSGKTEILEALKAKGEQVIDLENLSNHKGSAFGALGFDPQPTTEHFENELHAILRNMNTESPQSGRIWLEDESRNLGKVYIPSALWQQMRISPVIFIEVDKPIRIERLRKEYACFPKSELETSLNKIHKRLGGKAYQEALAALEENDMEKVADITLSYYDRAYLRLIGMRDQELVQRLVVDQYDVMDIAENLIQTANNIAYERNCDFR